MTPEEKRERATIGNAKRRAEWRKKTLDKMGGVCVDCGIEDLRILTVDHPDGDGNIHRIRHQKHGGPNWKKYYEDACAGVVRMELRCPNCHAIRDLKRLV